VKLILVSVTNDLITDQRVDRVCRTLQCMGFRVELNGRIRRKSLPLTKRDYETYRMRLWFEKGPLFYAAYNISLFFRLFGQKPDVLLANDLDSLPANFLYAKMKKKPLVVDCHEYFTGVPELNGRPITKWVWKRIERWIFPHLKEVFAVNGSVAGLLREEYKIPVKVVRNVPLPKVKTGKISRKDLGIPDEARIILYQGAVNMGRGLEEAIQSIPLIRHKVVLLILGDGDVLDALKDQVSRLNLTDRVIFTGAIPMEQLFDYTCVGDIGLSIEKTDALNYRLCLPNKFLDYIHAGVPVLVTPFEEMKRIVDQFQIGEFIDSHSPHHIASRIDEMLSAPEKLHQYARNTVAAAAELNWNKEEIILKEIFAKYA